MSFFSVPRLTENRGVTSLRPPGKFGRSWPIVIDFGRRSEFDKNRPALAEFGQPMLAKFGLTLIYLGEAHFVIIW